MALFKTFQDSLQMAAQNLINFYLHEELADNVSDVLIQSLMGLMLTHQKPFADLVPMHLAMLLNTLVQMGRDQERLRKMKSQVEDCFTKFVFANISSL